MRIKSIWENYIISYKSVSHFSHPHPWNPILSTLRTVFSNEYSHFFPKVQYIKHISWVFILFVINQLRGWVMSILQCYSITYSGFIEKSAYLISTLCDTFDNAFGK